MRCIPFVVMAGWLFSCGPAEELDTPAEPLGTTRHALKLIERYTIGSFTGVAHYGNDSVPRDDAFIPPSGVFTGSGKRPSTSILWNWTGNTDSPGVNSTGAERNEKAVGGLSFGEGHVYWLDFWVYFDPSTTNPNVVDWNYIMQHRSSGGTAPSPSPCIGILGNNLILRRNINGYGSAYDVIGALDEGGGWHHYQVGYKWSVSASGGWVEAWRDGVNVLPRKAVRTALDTSSGASLRFGGGYRTPSINGPVKYWLWGLEVHDARVASAPAPTPMQPAPPSTPPPPDAPEEEEEEEEEEVASPIEPDAEPPNETPAEPAPSPSATRPSSRADISQTAEGTVGCSTAQPFEPWLLFCALVLLLSNTSLGRRRFGAAHRRRASCRPPSPPCAGATLRTFHE